MIHLACIMDGNRRWAKMNYVPTIVGYQKGLQTLKTVIAFCIKKKMSYLTLYVFSIQNFLSRSQEEKNIIFTVMLRACQEAVEFAHTHNIRVFFIGKRSLFPQDIQDLCEYVEQNTKHATGLQLSLLFGYGGQEEIVETTKKIALHVQEQRLSIQDITCEVIKHNSWTGHFPAPDLIIRTGNVQRLSNFLLFQAAYAELYFLSCMWPDLSEKHLDDAYSFFSTTERNFGK